MHALLDGVADDEPVHHRRPLLADPVHAPDGLCDVNSRNQGFMPWFHAGPDIKFKGSSERCETTVCLKHTEERKKFANLAKQHPGRARQKSYSRNKFLATTYKDFFSAL